MTITICGSVVFSDKHMEVKKELEAIGHTVYVTGHINNYLGKEEKEIEQLGYIDKINDDAIRDHWRKIKKSDAILVLNYDRTGIKNYIGGNTFLEIGFAHVLDKKIYLLNPIPDINFYKEEIEAIHPEILYGDVGKINEA